MKIVTLKSTSKCAYDGCNQSATMVVCGRGDKEEGRHPDPDVYCDVHGRVVMDEGPPEYTHNCPNCGCYSGAN